MTYPAYVSLHTPKPFASARRHGPLGGAIPATRRTVKGWTGPVVRRPVSAYQAQRSVGIVRCRHCREWTAESNDVCSACHIPGPVSCSELIVL